MNILLWIEKAFRALVDMWLKGKFPAYAKLFDRADDVLLIAGECVTAAQATGADGPAKKAQASADLLAKIQAAGIDLPGDQDLAICGVIVEAMVAGLKSFLHLS